MKPKNRLTAVILLFVAVLATQAYAQPDSCNMTLVDEWAYYTTAGSRGIASIGDYILVLSGREVNVLEIDDAGLLTHVSSLDKGFPSVTVKDSFVYFLSQFGADSSHISTYALTTAGNLDSISTMMFETAIHPPIHGDTLLLLITESSDYIVLNISKPESAFVSITGEITREIAYGKYFEYPLVYGKEAILRGESPRYDWYHAKLYITDISDPDSPFVAYEGWSRYPRTDVPPDEILSSRYHCMTKKDSILYIGGNNRFIEAYNISADGTAATYITSWEYPDDRFAEAVNISRVENLLFASAQSRGLHIFDISDPGTLEYVAYYKPFDYDYSYYLDYTRHCVKDSFMISLNLTWPRDDTIRVSVFKFNIEGHGNCELDIRPDMLDFDIYPNPFNSNCKIGFSLEGYEKPVLSIFNLQGRKVLDKSLELSQSSYLWDATGEASGVYIVVLRQGDNTTTKRVMLLK